MKKNTLILTAHTDDEVLGCGRTIARYIIEGNHAHVGFIADGVSSSTEWQFSGTNNDFIPNYFVDISNFLDKKLESLKEYEYEIQKWPHPRSIRSIDHLAYFRGSQVGIDSAEASMVGRIIR